MEIDGAQTSRDGPRIVSVEPIHRGWASLSIVRVALPDGRELAHEVEDHGAAVSVLPYDPERRVALLVRQFRVPPFFTSGVVETLEAPAGLLEDEAPEQGARREALEEVGVRLRALESVTQAWAMSAVSTETLTLFLAAFDAGDVVASGGGIAAEGENIRVETVPLDRLAAMADAGQLMDMKTLVLVLTLRHRRPELFMTIDDYLGTGQPLHR